ncbi:MAG: SRPBCC family protein [Dehalococcoidia bacterium]|nr:SRPBCC family protein [Dehalococcoidia bacterium]
MTLQRFQATQLISAPLDEAWAFFSDPRNLSAITPPDMGFEITSEVPDHIYPGLFVTYRVRPLLGVPVEWVTEITQVDEGSRFIDEQRMGPYRLWHHEHTFRPAGDMTEMRDVVYYALPFGRLGALALPVVRSRIERIFEYRADVLDERFNHRYRSRPSVAGTPTAAYV